MRLPLALTVIVLCSALPSQFAESAVLAITDLDGDYEATGAYGVSGPLTPSGLRMGHKFILPGTQAYSVSRVDFAAYHRGGPNLYVFKIYDGDDLPDELVAESDAAPLPPGEDNATHAPTSQIEFSTPATLLGSKVYWLALDNLQGGVAIWARSNTVQGEAALASQQAPPPLDEWYPRGTDWAATYAIMGDAVPEPATAALLVIGVGAIGRRRLIAS